MPAHNSRAAVSNRLARRVNQVDPKRLALLEDILLESSSIPLNDGANQQSSRQALDNHTRLLELIDELRQIESTCNPKLPCRSEQSWSEFFRWIDTELSPDQKGARLSDRLGVSDSSPSCDEQTPAVPPEYALVAKMPIKAGEQIFAVHRKVIMSTETVAKDDDLFEFIKKDSIASAMQNVVLVLHLLNEYSKKEKSYWCPYLSILPSKILPVLLHNKESLRGLLASSHIFEALKMIRAIARQYTYFFKRLRSINLPLSKDFTYEYYCWGVSVVCSRQNEVPPSSRQTSLLPVAHALIPILDMCNHDRYSNQACFEGNESHLMASKDLNTGDEITINYGSRSSGEFYIHNGFVPKEVPLDIVPLTIVLQAQDSLYEAKARLLKTLNMPTFGRFRLTHNDYSNRHKRDPHLTMFLIVYLLSEDELELINSSENPVGIADEIYEYVQYGHNSTSCNGKESNESGASALDKTEEVKDEPLKSKMVVMKERLARVVREYLSKRASISMALIDRTLSDHEKLDVATSTMLQHERSIYLSHLIKCSAN